MVSNPILNPIPNNPHNFWTQYILAVQGNIKTQFQPPTQLDAAGNDTGVPSNGPFSVGPAFPVVPTIVKWPYKNGVFVGISRGPHPNPRQDPFSWYVVYGKRTRQGRLQLREYGYGFLGEKRTLRRKGGAPGRAGRCRRIAHNKVFYKLHLDEMEDVNNDVVRGLRRDVAHHHVDYVYFYEDRKAIRRIFGLPVQLNV
ncbi:MAG: hypothetical protein M1818_007870 [Claussenomyces sp. TS43310]|nr:MAG: hypothetical protein M1818_007870 [Claussenomyces sp. TS43310]